MTPRLSSGAQVGPYEVVGPLGAGGMGEVYRARDARLGRDVALKVLPAILAADPERLARFTREAQVLASLNHAGIAAIYGLEESGDTKALVLELVEGPTLGERLTLGPLPLDEALSTAAAIAEALDAAHEHGIVHRDLKPANVKLRPDGVVKVLDFGLAKALDSTSGFGVDASLSPTLTAQATRSGIILGTAAYMAPEQAKGKTVDRRADIWAFGAVLFEMLTGKRLFDGETPSEVLAQVILKEPDLTALPETTPAHVRHLLARCLERDPKTRLRDIGEARLALLQPRSLVTSGGTLIAPASGIGGGLAGAGAGSRPSSLPGVDAARRRSLLPWVVGLLVVALITTMGPIVMRLARPAPRQVARYDIQVPKEIAFDLSNRPSVALNPGGTMLAFIGTQEGISRIYVRRRDEAEAHAVPGSEGASNPVFSPDGRWLAFTSDNRLKKSSIEGSVIDLAPVSDGRGIAWVDSGNIVYAPEPIGGLMRIPANGGTPVPVTQLVEKDQERTHRWPEALPGGKTVLFTIGSMGSPDNYDASVIQAVDLATGKRKDVLHGAAMARFVPPSTLVYARTSALYGISFDPETLETSGDSVALLQEIASDIPTGATHFAYAGDGTLAYISGSDRSGRTVFWVDRDGNSTPIGLPAGVYNDLRLSPDRSRMAIAVGSTGAADIWVYDFTRTIFTRVTFTNHNGTPVWSKDGTALYYASYAPPLGATTVYRVLADGSRPPEEILALAERTYLYGLTPDSSALVVAFATRTQNSKSNIMRVPLAKGAKPTPLAASDWDEYNASLSPAARYVAYQSNDTGRDEIYVRDTAGAGGRWQVSTLGGEEPSWSADGKEMYYRNENRLMVVPVQTGATFSVGVPRILINGILAVRSDTGISYDVDSANKRFLMVRLASNVDPNTGLRVVLNWRDELERLMAGAR
ncbi:MAG TPA: protein kinase [Candidatus Polarisedimenticolia bacterium]|nr:protein kinase [Candidatus Polarisedimenticolia bacterium]